MYGTWMGKPTPQFCQYTVLKLCMVSNVLCHVICTTVHSYVVNGVDPIIRSPHCIVLATG